MRQTTGIERSFDTLNRGSERPSLPVEEVIMQAHQAANTLRLAREQIERTGAVSGAVLNDFKRLVRDLDGKDTQLD